MSKASPSATLAALWRLACLPDGLVQQEIRSKRLRRVLADWCPAFPGYHLYYPSRRQHSPAFALVVAALQLTG